MEKLPELHFPLRHPLSALHPQKGRKRICYSSLYPKCIKLLSSMDAFKMQDTKAMTAPFPCYENISGGQEWPRI